MPIPRVVARSNRYLANPLFRRLAGRVPPLVLIEHRGRRSGKPYATPVLGFRDGSDPAWVVALTYGLEVDWLKNLRAAGGGVVVARGERSRTGPPVVGEGIAAASAIPAPIRAGLRLMRVDWFVRLPPSPDGQEGER